LYSARTELAELAVGRERLRVSRDLHDVLGQSLSAVALKGDLALRLLPDDRAGARAEIESLTRVARDTLRDVRAVTRDEHRVSFAAEVDAAVALLEAAGIATSVDVDARGLPALVDEALAWAVREGATNALRHSTATNWSVTTTRRGGEVRLAIVNDGAPEQSGSGTGIAGLVMRARAVNGTVSAVRMSDGLFNLSVTIAEEAP
jgi:two-component system sensor histidine kinase DesK